MRALTLDLPRAQVIEAKTANAMLTVESEDVRVDNRCVPLVPLFAPHGPPEAAPPTFQAHSPLPGSESL